MPKVTKEYDFDVDEELVVTETGNPGWVTAVQNDRSGRTLYCVETTLSNGRPATGWYTASQLAEKPSEPV